MIKSLTKIISLCLILLTTIACNQTKTKANLITRGMIKVAVKAYHYKSLATFKSGTPTLTLDNLAALEGKKVNLVVLYEADAPWAKVFNTGKYTTTGNDSLNGIIASYELVIVKQFEIDEENEGLVLEADSNIDNPVEAARKLSMIDNVLMVHVKEVPVIEESIVEESTPNN